MGQSSSTGSKSVVPSTNLLIDCSDSYVTDVKLRSTTAVPISEYIRKDKFNKIQHFDDSKRKIVPKLTDVKKDKVTVGILKGGKKDDRAKTAPTDAKDTKKEKEKFIESSFEDLPNKRKWVSPQIPSDNLPNKSNKDEEISSMKVNKSVASSENVMELYKNDVYPHIYKNNYKRKNAQKEKLKEKQGTKTDTFFPGIPKFKCKNITRKYEESTHQLNQHNYEKRKYKGRRNKLNLSIQTNVACIIHPDKSRQVRFCSSDETIKRRSRSVRKRNTSDTEISFSSHTAFASKINKFEKTRREPKITLSAKEALESWKNTHTMKQSYKEDRKLTRDPEIFPIPTKHRSRAGYRDRTRTPSPPRHRKMTPLEQSNYNYTIIAKSEYLSPHEIKERMKNKRRSACPRHELVDYTSYGGYDKPHSSSSEESQTPDRENFIADIERCLQKRHQMAKNFRTRSPNHSRTTWVQDKYRRWHKVLME